LGLEISELTLIFVKNKNMTTITDKNGNTLKVCGGDIKAMQKCVSLNKDLSDNEWSLKDCNSLKPSEYEGYIEMWYHGFWRPGFG